MAKNTALMDEELDQVVGGVVISGLPKRISTAPKDSVNVAGGTEVSGILQQALNNGGTLSAGEGSMV
ncbi:MAG: hypothetical protein IJT32_07575 [Lachnospiraceae bacterium]|nr:hypothetical protein [Lachnospiraceae bacterium]